MVQPLCPFIFFFPSCPTLPTSPGTNSGCGHLLSPQKHSVLEDGEADLFHTPPPLSRAVSHLPAWLRNVCLENPRGLGLDCALRRFSVTEWIHKRTVSVWERQFIFALREEGNPPGPGDCHLWPPLATELALVQSCGRVSTSGQGGEGLGDLTSPGGKYTPVHCGGDPSQQALQLQPGSGVEGYIVLCVFL